VSNLWSEAKKTEAPRGSEGRFSTDTASFGREIRCSD
jgi:hypothetical protein